MLNIDLHRSVEVNILREIYSDSLLRTALGFKGGTAAMLFYGLPRFSVDLDFNLLDGADKGTVVSKVTGILKPFGRVIEATGKRYTLFWLLSYQKGERMIKVEISKRQSIARFEVKHYLGISMLVMARQDMAAGKMAALLNRKKFAARDLFDLWFFFKNNWPVSIELLREQTGLDLPAVLSKALEKVQAVKKGQLLQGLGDLLGEKQKSWVREQLKDELIFLLQLYQERFK